ncbi:hypothetical protein [Actinomadura sp. WMMB 499]|nr:hypothetical protein [Actinomadura sp. WMMB 499]
MYDDDVYTRTRTSGSEVQVLTVNSDNQITATPIEHLSFEDLEDLGVL